MSFFKNVFGKKDRPINTNNDFWNWFRENEKQFYNVVKQHTNIEKDFFDKISPNLDALKEGYFFLTGMYDDDTVELILTADGIVKNIAFVEDLVHAAPEIKGWRFTAHKPASDIAEGGIKMAGYEFNDERLSFYANENEYPDEIDITVVHSDFNEENKEPITSGTFIFLDNFLGELNFVTAIDNLTVVGKEDVTNELVPISKLKDFLLWREKEFVEKYEGVRYNTDNDNYAALEGEMSNGNPMIAVINTDLLRWDSKASHPWLLSVILKYDGDNNAGMPTQETFDLLNQIEEDILNELKDFDGYLNIGRETANSTREIYFACKDFRNPSKVMYDIQKTYTDQIDMSYDVYKDKYWQSYNRYNV